MTLLPLVLLSALGARASGDLYVGGQVASFLPVGVVANATLKSDDRPRWDVDALLEPSLYWQSLSVGGGWRPFGNAFFLGGRARWLQWHVPFSRGYDLSFDNALGLEADLGGRFALGDKDRLQLATSLGFLGFPLSVVDVPPTVTLSVGAGWSVRQW